MPSANVPVRGIIEQLSEGICDLVMTVILLAEQNAPLEPSMIQKSIAINQQATNLGVTCLRLPVF